MGDNTLNNFKGIKLDGIYREAQQLENYCLTEIKNKSNPEWLCDIYRFIIEWISDSDVIIAKTSGSTGTPKIVKLKKKHMIASAKKTITYFKIQANHTALLGLSTNYIAGKMMIVRAMVGGFNLLLAEPKGNPLESLCDHVDFTAMVPFQVANSINDFEKGVKIQTVIIGGGALSRNLKVKLTSFPIQFYETYGMTETVSHVAIRKIGDEELFHAMPNVTFEKDDRDCLIINSPDILTSKLVTNDIVELKNCRSFQLLGRFDHVINTGGIKILPEKLEEKLQEYISCPFYISSIPDDKLGEKLVIVTEEKSAFNTLNQKDLFELGISSFEMPKEVVQVKNFPYTRSDKIDRNSLRQLIRAI